MKIRSGFVSNSSSCSWVIISPREFDPFQVFEDIEEQDFARECFNAHNIVILGQEATVWEVYQSSDGCYDIIETEGFEELAKKHGCDEYTSEYEEVILFKFLDAFRNNKDCYINEDYR